MRTGPSNAGGPSVRWLAGIAVLCLLVGALLAGVFLQRFRADRALSGGTRAEAEVVEIESLRGDSSPAGHDSSMLRVAFPVASDRVVATLTTKRFRVGTRPLQVGDRLPITYDPQNPQRVRSVDGADLPWRTPLLVASMFAFFGLLMGGSAISTTRARRQWSEEQGLPAPVAQRVGHGLEVVHKLAAGTTGPMFGQSMLWAAMSIPFIGLGVAAATSVVDFRPDRCETDRLGTFGASMAFLGFAWLMGRPALQDLMAAIRGRKGGTATLRQDGLLLDIPGLLRSPFLLPRAHIEAAHVIDPKASFRADTAKGRAGDLRFSMTKRHLQIVLREPVHVTEATHVPRVFQRYAPTQPTPWAPVGTLTLEPTDPRQFAEDLAAWARDSQERPKATDAPARSYRFVLMTAIGAAAVVLGLALMSAGLPNGPGC